MKFSQRIGKTAASKEIQLEQIDEELKNRLWNLIKKFYIDELEKNKQYGMPEFKIFANITWHNFYKLSVDKVPFNYSKIEAYIRQRFYEGEWYEIYDFIEFILNLDFNQGIRRDFVNALNKVLESEFSGYRIIGNKVAPISNSLEFEEVSTAIGKTGYLTALKGANIHLDNALDLITD